MADSWLQQLYWGCEYGSSATARRKILNTNIAALLSTASIALYGLVYIAASNVGLTYAALASFPFCLLFAFIPWLNHKGHTRLASWLVGLALPSLLVSIMSAAQGSYLDLHYYFLAFALIPSMFFGLQQWRALAFFFVLNMAAFLYAEYMTVAPDPTLYGLAPWLVSAMRAGYKVTTLFTLLFALLLAEYSASTNETRLETLSTTDRLTGIANRLHLDTVLDKEFARAERQSTPFSIILLDIDKFKSVNDTYGHPVGDTVLVEVSKVLKSNLRSYDLVGRWGGEEFLVICSETTAADAATVAEKLRAALAVHPIAVAGSQTASFGVTTYRTGDELGDMVRRADEALYRAKQGGRNKVEIGL